MRMRYFRHTSYAYVLPSRKATYATRESWGCATKPAFYLFRALLSKREGLTKQLLTTTTLAKQLLKSLRALVPSKELTNFTAAGRIGFKYIYRELPNLSDRLYIETDWQKIPQRERLPIPSRQGERRFTGSICSTRSEHSRRRTTECQANSTHKMGEVVFLVERALQHHAASHLQTFYVSKVHKK